MGEETRCPLAEKNHDICLALFISINSHLYYFFSLFLSGANPNSEDYDLRTPLHSAIVKGSRYSIYLDHTKLTWQINSYL